MTAGAPGALDLDLRAHLDHSEWIDARVSLLDTYAAFQRTGRESLAVIEGPRFVGVVQRGRVGFLLGSPYGNSIYGKRPVRSQLSPTVVRVTARSPLRDAVDAVLRRPRDCFAEDVAVVEADDVYVGMVAVATLVRLQAAALAHQLQVADAQRAELAERNGDLTRSLERLRESEGRHRTIFAVSPVGIALLDRSGRIETHNARMAEIAGRTPGAHFADLACEADRQALRAFCVERSQPGQTQELDVTVETPHLGPRVLHLAARTVHETGQHCVTADDVTERRALARRIAAREKSDLLDALVGGVAHELNNKLAPVLGFAELLGDAFEGSLPGRPERQWCRAIQTCAAESAGIIRQLLQLSRPIAEEARQVDLAATVAEALLMCRFRVRDAGAAVETRAPESPVHVVADPAELKQVVINLVLNAADAVASSAVRRIEVSVEGDATAATLSVRDSGHGIRPEHAKRVFEPFFTTKGPDRGTGLGLPVCRGIVHRFGGEIDFESEAGRGATFRVVLPRVQPAPDTDDPPTVGIGPPAAAAAGPGGLRILVIDDEDPVAGLMCAALRGKFPGAVDRAAHGDEALRLLGACEYDLVVCDVRLPGLQGPDIYERAIAACPALTGRFLFVTGDTGGAGVRERLASLRVPVLAKPFRVTDLVERCTAVLAAGATA